MRLFTEADLQPGQSIPATENQSHYLTVVMRRNAADPVILFNGRDGEWLAHIAGAGRRVRLEVMTQLRPQGVEPDIWLLFAPLKRQPTELVVQKATELGVAALRPVITGRTQGERVNDARLRLIAIEAAEQCERLSVPVIHPPQRLPAVLEKWQTARPLHVAMERRAAPRPHAGAGPAALLVGPEGGFAPQELDAMSAHPFVHPVSLGPRVLRAETAAIVGLALLLLSD